MLCPILLSRLLSVSQSCISFLCQRTELTVNRLQESLKSPEELKSGKPIQYILGETSFYDCIIKLNSATLIPRPETEELVHLIINENREYNGNIIDFGTGSGCIAIALAANIPGSRVTGIDISEDAIRMANENALLNNVTVSFLTGDIFNFENIQCTKSRHYCK